MAEPRGPIHKALGDRIRQLRDERGWKQDAFAVQYDIDRSFYGEIERGEANPSLETLMTITDGLGITLCQLFCDDESHSL